MNELVFLIMVYVGAENNLANFKSPVKSFDTIAACETARNEMFKANADILERSRCVAVFPPTKVEVVEKPVVKCVRPPSDGYNAGKKCVEA